MTQLLRRLVRAYVELSFRRPWVLTATYALLAVAASVYAVTHLRVVTDLAALLPQGTLSVQALDESQRRIGSTDFFTIAIESKSGNREAIVKLQNELAARITRDWQDAKWVQTTRDTSFFRAHALYYLPVEELERLEQALEEELLRASAKAIPGLVDLLDEPQSDKGPSPIERWYDPQLPRRLGMPAQVADELASYFSVKEPAKSEESAPSTSEASTGGGRLISPTGNVGVVLVQLGKPSTDLDFARFALQRGEALIASVGIPSGDGDVTASVVGAYRSFREVDAVSSDGTNATLVSLVLVLAVMFVAFRRGRVVLIIFWPLLLASSATLAVTALVFGRLTLLTVFILGMLFGMGIDYGIHLFARVLDEMRGGQSPKEATHTALQKTGAAMAAAAATTIASLLTLLLGHFQGFHEFGIVASIGITASALFSALSIPPLVAGLERLRPMVLRVEGRATPKKPRILGLEPRLYARLAFALALCFTAAAAWFSVRVEFEYDFRNLRAPRTGASIPYGSAIGKSSGTAPAVILGKSEAEMRVVHEHLLMRQNQVKDEKLNSFITVHTFVPTATDQAERHAHIATIGTLLEKKAWRRLDGPQRRMVDELRRMTQAGPFTVDEIPQWARSIVTEADGTVGHIGHMYTKIRDWDAREVQALQADYGFLRVDGELVPIACSAFILSDVVRMVQADGVALLVFVTIVLLIILLAFSRSLKGLAVLGLTVGTSVLWTAGVMGFFGLRLGLYNLIAIPVILGVGIDSAIYLYHKQRADSGTAGLARNLRSTGLTITASTFTTVAGFLGLCFVTHLGLRTIGYLAATGVAAAWASVMLLQPWLLLVAFPESREPSIEPPPSELGGEAQ